MSTVSLVTLWLNDAQDLSDYRQFPLLSALTVTVSTPGEVRTRANGRRVSVTRAGGGQKFDVALRYCDRDLVAWLQAKTGRTLLVRDDRGRRMFGVYYDMPVIERGYEPTGDVTLSLLEVTVNEAV